MIFLIIASLIFLVLSVWRPAWAVFLIVLCLPTYQIRFHVFGLPTTWLEIMIGILFIVWLINKIKNQKLKVKITNQNLKLNNWLVIILLWLAVSLVAIFISPDRLGALGFWRAYFLEPILLVLVLIDLAGRDPDIRMHSNGTNIHENKNEVNNNLGGPISCTKKSAETADSRGSRYSTINPGLVPNTRIANLNNLSRQSVDNFLGRGPAGNRTPETPVPTRFPYHTRPTAKLLYYNFKHSQLFNGSKPALILFGLALSALYCSIWAILQKWLGGGVMSTEVLGAPKVWRATGPFPQPNFLGLYLGPIIVLCFGQIINLWREGKKYSFPYIFYLITFILSFTAILAARSEGAIIGVLAGLIFLALWFKKGRWPIIIIVVVLILFVLILPTTRSWLAQITYQKLSGQLRLNIWQGTLAMIKTHPFFGVGLRGYQKLAPQYQEPYYSPQTKQLVSVETHPYPHNLFLAIWVELGILGLIVFLWILVKFFYQGFSNIIQTIQTYPTRSFDRSPRRMTGANTLNRFFIIFILAAMMVILVHGSVDTPYFKNDLAVLFWLIIGLLIVETGKAVNRTT